LNFVQHHRSLPYLHSLPTRRSSDLFQHANAQVKAGVRMGLNYTDLTELRPQDNSGFHLGTYLKLSLAGIVAVEPGAQYSKRKFTDRKSTRLNSSHVKISYAVFCLKK